MAASRHRLALLNDTEKELCRVQTDFDSQVALITQAASTGGNRQRPVIFHRRSSLTSDSLKSAGLARDTTSDGVRDNRRRPVGIALRVRILAIG